MNIYTEFEKELLARLESIERMLGEESKQFLSESAIPSPGMILIQDEPEWRPMSTAPSNKNIRVKRFDTDEEFYACWDKGINMWVCDSPLKLFQSFKAHEHELSGWRPIKLAKVCPYVIVMALSKLLGNQSGTKEKRQAANASLGVCRAR